VIETGKTVTLAVKSQEVEDRAHQAAERFSDEPPDELFDDDF